MLPFAGGLSSSANGTLVFSIIAAILYGIVLFQPPNIRRTIIKTLAIGLLAVLAFQSNAPLFLVLALTLSALGDAFLAHDGDKAFMGGLSAFLIGHIFYIVLFAQTGADFSVFAAEPWRMVLAACLVVLAGFMATRLLPVTGSLAKPVLVYIAVITIMGVYAAMLDQPLAIIGAVMFMASDALLSTEKFLLAPEAKIRQPIAIAVWSLYYIGQLFIALAFLVI